MTLLTSRRQPQSQTGLGLAADAQLHSSSASLTLAITSLGTLLVLVVFTIPVATLTSTATALGAGPGSQAWILSAMSVGAAAGLLSSGAIGDDYGRRRTFLAGILLLAGSSVLGALAPTALVLVIARIVQGLGGAAVIACGLGLIGHTFPSGHARVLATGVWAASLGAGVAIGPILSAGLDMLGGWRLPYALTALAAIALALVGRLSLTESRNGEARRIDVAGTLLLGAGLVALLAGLVEGRAGWAQPLVIVLLLGALVLLVGFVAVENRIAGPMLDLALFRKPDFVGATVAAFTAGAGVASLVSFLPTLLERAMGVSSLTASTMLLAWSATGMVTAYGSRWLPKWMTHRAQLIISLVSVAVGQLALIMVNPGNELIRVLPGLFMVGIANGFLNAALGHQAVASVPANRIAMGSGANNTARYVGSSIGLTVVAVLVTHAGANGGTVGLLYGWNMAVLVTVGFSLLGALAVFAARPKAAIGESSASGVPVCCGKVCAASNRSVQ